MEPATPKIQARLGARVRTWLLASLVALATLTVLVRLDGGADALGSAGHALTRAAPLVAAWLLSALGLGTTLARRATQPGLATRLALGTAALLVIDQWCGTLGVFQLGVIGALAPLAPGWWMLSRLRLSSSARDVAPWTCVAWGLAAGAMLAASLVPAGFLWSTEFGGYDALEYHLQVPREWLAAGSMRPLPHLAYAGLPNFVEGAFMHLMALRADAREAAIACQLLHACMALTAAATLREAVRGALGGNMAGDAAALALLATPWVTVTGSLAYDEGGVLLALALAMRAATSTGAWSGGAAFGLAVGVMVGAKASSAVLAVPSAMAWALMVSRHPRHARWWIAAAVPFAVAVAPWLARNAEMTGNPLFPLLAEHLGLGWWTPEQAARFASAHHVQATLAERLLALWRQGCVFGLGPNPLPGEPWRFLWGPLPWIGVAALVALPLSRAPRRPLLGLAGMLVCTCVAWMAFTHLQSRFLLPAAVPLAAAVGAAAEALCTRVSLRRAVALAALGWSLLPTHALLSDRPRQPDATDRPGALALAGRIDLPTGELDAAILRGTDDAAAQAVRAEPSTEAALATLFPGARVLSVGWSTPFWLAPSTPLRWSTVWDTNPIELALREPDPQAWLQDRFDLLLIDEAMLQRWKSSGWLSPALDPARLQPLLDGRDAMLLTNGRRLVSLQGALQPAWPARPARLPDPSAY